MHGNSEYVKGTLFRATRQIGGLTGEEELQVLIHDGVLVIDGTMQVIADATVTMRYCSEDEFLGGADVLHPCEYMAEFDGEECTCDIVDVKVAIRLDVLTEADNKREPKQVTGLPDPSKCSHCAECQRMGMIGCLGHYPKEKESCGCEAEHLGPDGYGCKLNKSGIGKDDE